MRIHFLLLASIAFALTACGGGGGEGASTNAVAPPPSQPALGSRAMPGCTITVTPETAILAGQPASVLISAPDFPIGATLTAAVGADRYLASAVALTPLSATQWRATMILPDPLPIETGVLVTVTLADGSMLESGMEDFLLVH